jgi:hypothetical protein
MIRWRLLLLRILQTLASLTAALAPWPLTRVLARILALLVAREMVRVTTRHVRDAEPRGAGTGTAGLGCAQTASLRACDSSLLRGSDPRQISDEPDKP